MNFKNFILILLNELIVVHLSYFNIKDMLKCLNHISKLVYLLLF